MTSNSAPHATRSDTRSGATRGAIQEVAAGVWLASAQHVCWTLITEGDELTLVDTGYPGDRERVIASLEEIGRGPADVAAIVLTHAHPDHIGSAEWLRDAMRLGVAKAACVPTVATFDGYRLDVPGRPVPVHTPGHTSGHGAFHLPDRGVLLVGDALLTAHALVKEPGPRLLPSFFNADTAQARESLHRLASLDTSVIICGHGPPFIGSPSDAVTAALSC